MEKKEMKYEEAMSELTRIVTRLENEHPDIDTLGEQLRRAQTLLKLCRERLTKTDEEISEILKSQEQPDGDAQ